MSTFLFAVKAHDLIIPVSMYLITTSFFY